MSDERPEADERCESSSASVRRLPAETVERIAAGEVITRPARVVTELIENALDADATRIEIEVTGDGTERIVVRDDGRGLSTTDARRAVEPHTTSKLGDHDDLRRVDTLGFRGEALASVADAADEVVLTTNDSGTEVTTDSGTEVIVDSDGVTVTEAARGRGTTVTVRGLFADRPVRRESLASPAQEFGRISQVVTRYAVVHDDVAVRLVHDGTETLSTAGTGLRDALLSVYDRETAADSTAVSHETTVPELRTSATHDTPAVSDTSTPPDTSTAPDTSVVVDGRVCYPSVTRSDRRGVTVAVNGRPVANAALERAVTSGYGRLLGDGEKPVAVVRVRLPPTAVDANVHPAKRQVALRVGDAVAAAVTTAVEEALTTADLARTATVATDIESSLEPVEETDSAFDDAAVIGQYRALYLLCEAGDDLLVVDQHAAHERVTFERLRAAASGEDGGVASGDGGEPVGSEDAGTERQPVDPPVAVSLDPETAAAVEAHDERLRELGFETESFGGATVRVHAVPAPLGRAADPEALREVASGLARGADPDPEGAVLAELACHPSLKAGEEIDDETARRLLRRLGECAEPYACPHGRPTVLSVSEATFARAFERESTRLD